MKKLLALWALIIVCNGSIFGQRISNIDFEIIKREISDASSIFYYPNLLNRFKQKDSTLSFLDYQHLYYGAVFQSFYSPYYHSKNFEKFNQFYVQEKFKKALNYGLDAFEDTPVNLQLIFRLAVCHMAIGNKETARQYAQMYYRLLDVIYSGGNGKSTATAFVVISVADEYEIVADNKLQVKKQRLSGETDILEFSKKGQNENKPKIKKLYFNVHFPLTHLAKSFNFDNNE